MMRSRPREYDVRRILQPDGVDFLLEPREDDDLPRRGQQLLLGIAGLCLLAALASLAGVVADAALRAGWIESSPWWGLPVGLGVGAAALGVQAWVLGLDDGEVRVALRLHHVTVEGRRVPYTAIAAVEERDGRIVLRLEAEEVVLPTADPELLRELRRAVDGAVEAPAVPPALQRLRQERAARER